MVARTQGRRRAKSQFGDHDDNSGWNASYAAFAPTFTLRPILTLVRYQRRPTHQGGDRCGPLGFNNTMAAVIRDIGYSLYDREERADHVRLRCGQEERPSLAPAHGGRRITDVGFALSSIDPSPPPAGSRIPLPTLSLNRGDILAARGNEGLRRCPFSLRAAAGGSGLVVQRCESTSGELFQSTPSPQLQGICTTEFWAKITVVPLGDKRLFYLLLDVLGVCDCACHYSPRQPSPINARAKRGPLHYIIVLYCTSSTASPTAAPSTALPLRFDL